MKLKKTVGKILGALVILIGLMGTITLFILFILVTVKGYPFKTLILDNPKEELIMGTMIFFLFFSLGIETYKYFDCL